MFRVSQNGSARFTMVRRAALLCLAAGLAPAAADAASCRIVGSYALSGGLNGAVVFTTPTRGTFQPQDRRCSELYQLTVTRFAGKKLSLKGKPARITAACRAATANFVIESILQTRQCATAQGSVQAGGQSYQETLTRN